MCNGVVQGFVLWRRVWEDSKCLHQNLQLSVLDPNNSETVQMAGISLRCPWDGPSIFPGMGALGKVGEGGLPGI